MDENTTDNLKNLFLQNKQEKIFDICNSMISKDKNDIELLYCAGFASLMIGKIQDGFQFFERLLNLIPEPDIRVDTLLFLGVSALQIAEFTEFFNGANKTEVYHYSVTCANNIAVQTANKELEAMAKNMSLRLVKKDNRPFHIIPKSPDTLQIEPTNLCNLKCAMCPRSLMSREKGYMDIKIWERTILGWSGRKNELTGTHLVFNIPFTLNNLPGTIKMFFLGEPLLHPNFDGFIKFAKQEGCRIGIQTNGVLLKNPDIRKRLLESKLDEISLSLDGIDQNSYDSLRQGSQWETILESTRKLNDERQERGLETVTKISISTILIDKTDNTNINQALSFLEPIRPYIDNINAINLDRSYDPVFVDTDGQLHEFARAGLPRIEQGDPLCEEPLKKLTILWNGTVTACCHDINAQMVLGNVNHTQIDEIWRSKKTRLLHEALLNHDTSKHPLCKACRG